MPTDTPTAQIIDLEDKFYDLRGIANILGASSRITDDIPIGEDAFFLLARTLDGIANDIESYQAVVLSQHAARDKS
ncbi:MAG: hypothetical protein HQL37_15230 [Alphaproteobacteria bacterium]|nr:hypothetical protein [Alphaproteobacteria bacterium]